MNEAGLFFVSRCRLRNSGLVTLSPSAGFDPLRCALCDSSAEISLQPQQAICGKVEAMAELVTVRLAELVSARLSDGCRVPLQSADEVHDSNWGREEGKA